MNPPRPTKLYAIVSKGKITAKDIYDKKTIDSIFHLDKDERKCEVEIVFKKWHT